jgi:replicative DNA helicase
MKYYERLVEYEMLAIGMALNGRAGKIIDSGIVGETFFDKRCGTLFNAIIGAVLDGKDPTMIAIVKYLPVGHDLAKLMVDCSELGHTTLSEKEIIRIIKQNFVVRNAYGKISLISSEALNCDPLNPYPIMEKLELVKSGIKEGFGTSWTYEKLMSDCTQGLSDSIEGKNKKGYSTGNAGIDKALAWGLCPGRVYTLAGRPGAGKTTLALNWSYAASKAGAVPIYFTIEMSDVEIGYKLISLHGGISQSKIMLGDSSEDFLDKYYQAADELQKMKFGVCSTTGGSWGRLVSCLRNSVRYRQTSIAVIDYIQQFSTGQKLSFREDLDKIMHDVKSLAVELHIPIIVLSQLNRKIEDRKDTSPMLSDLKECGTIEQASDAVIILETKPDECVKAHILKNRWGYNCATFYQPDFDLNRFDVAPIDQ